MSDLMSHNDLVLSHSAFIARWFHLVAKWVIRYLMMTWFCPVVHQLLVGSTSWESEWFDVSWWPGYVPYCLDCSLVPPCGKVSDSMSRNDLVLSHSASIACWFHLVGKWVIRCVIMTLFCSIVHRLLVGSTSTTPKSNPWGRTILKANLAAKKVPTCCSIEGKEKKRR